MLDLVLNILSVNDCPGNPKSHWYDTPYQAHHPTTDCQQDLPYGAIPQSRRIFRFIGAAASDWDAAQTQILNGPLCQTQ
jgi:hypothetical protein